MLLQVLPSTLITSCPGTLSPVGSAAYCGCPDRLWCHYQCNDDCPGTLSLVGSAAYCGCPDRLWCRYQCNDDCPGTLSLVGSAADCGCPGRLWCQHHGILPDVLKTHYRGCKTTLALFYDVLQATGSNRETRFPRFHCQCCGKMYGTLTL